ncbi:MAG: penicillin-binding protein 1C [Hylemonella sp.]|nr:penicillin-binding protein 1C [Hylemonella sp.]
MKPWLRRHRRRLLVALALALALAFWRSLPSPLFDAPLSTLILARDGTLLGARIAADGQWRFPPVTQVPAKFRACLLAYEDKRFDWHPGVDPLAVARALRLNLGQGRIVSGGSTLTMQVVRMARGARERSYADKLLEMLLALRLELQYSKAEILALHASHAPFGGNVVGLEAASWRYFGRDPQQLSWAEACTLAVLPNSPALIHPGRHRARLQAKRDRLLQRLQGQGLLGALDLSLAQREPLPAQPLPLPQLAPHLLETLHQQYPDMSRLRTTLDARLQAAAVAAVGERARQLARQGVHNVAALVVDHRSFEVLAYVGNSEGALDGELGHAVDVIRRPRSSGSILKPFLYAAMLDAGEILPATLVPDVPTQYSGYMPENFDRDYRGAVPAEVALAQSLNVPAVRMLRQHGVHRFYDFLRQFGMSTLWRPPDDYGLTLILGGAEVTLHDIVGMYANLSDIAAAADGGGLRALRLLAADVPVARGADAGLSPGAAWLTLNALREVARPAEEGYWKNFASSRQIAWKTGTSWGLRDAWAIGNSARYTVGVWVGNASGEGRPGLTGSVAAAPLLFDLFNPLEATPWLERPELHLKTVQTCRGDGYLANGHCEEAAQWAPRDSQFDQLSPYHVGIHLDRSRRWRVHSGCARVADMVLADWFVLPPGPELFYRRHHADYRALPPYRADCDEPEQARGQRGPIDFLYPAHGTRVYIPVDLGERKSRVVFEAVHRDREAELHWHLDDTYIGSTRSFHQRALDASAGTHTITVVDAQGNRLSRAFEVLVRERR